MAITHIQTIRAVNTLSISITGVAVGNLLVLSSLTDSLAFLPTATVNDGHNTYQIGASVDDGINRFASHWWTVVSTGGNLTLTISPYATFTLLFLSEFNSTTGWKVSALDKFVGNNQPDYHPGVDSITSGPTSVRSQAEELLVGSFTDYQYVISTYTAGTGYTMPANGSYSFADYFLRYVTGATEYKIVSIVGTDAATFTYSVDQPSTNCILSTFATNNFIPPVPIPPESIQSTYFTNTSSLYFTKGVEYTISSYLYNTSSNMDSQYVPEFDFYLTKSWEGGQFPFESWECNELGYRIAIASLEKQGNFNIARLTDDDTSIGTTTDFMTTQTMQLIPKYSPIFFSNNFIPDFDGTASLLIYPKHGNWHFSEPSIKPFQTDNFNASEFEFKIT